MPDPKGKYITDNQIGEIQYWDLLKNGEKDGLEGIYKMFSQELFRHGMAIKPNRSFIKDCIQELFIDLWKYRNNLKTTDNIKLYLFRCLSNKIHKEIARDKNRYSQDDIDAYDVLLLENSPEQNLISHQNDEKIQKKLIQALEKLPLRQREAIQNLFFENHSYEETAKIMGINIQSVYTLAWKAIANLKKSILIILFFLLT
ncbi:RNA polymerase sigma factor [Aquiflexum sp.]|uniref:RNA polymerase sigma factor n=1 Tax=Aquiflexum sp. TaxID=1872584 RepID=UPI0035933DF7